MSVVKISPDKLELNTGKNLTAAQAIDASDGLYIDFAGKDHNILLLISGSASDTVTIKAGDGIQGVADETVTVDGSHTVAVSVESGRFKICSGEYKGYIHLTGKATTSVQAVELPV